MNCDPDGEAELERGTGVEYSVELLEARIVDTWDFSDAEVSRRRFLATVATLSPGDAEALVWRTQVARTHSLLLEFEQAHVVLDEAQVQAEDLRPGRSLDHVRARVAIERGRAFNSAGLPEAAAPLFDSAREWARSAGAAGVVIDALHMRAIVAGSLEGPGGAMRLNQRALAEAEASEDPAARRWRASLLNNLGWDAHELGRHTDALALFERAVPLREEAAKEPELTIARWTVARTLRSLGRFEEALLIHDELTQTQVGSDDGFVHEERGECLLELGREAEARGAFARAHELLSADAALIQREPDRIARLADLAGPSPSL